MYDFPSTRQTPPLRSKTHPLSAARVEGEYAIHYPLRRHAPKCSWEFQKMHQTHEEIPWVGPQANAATAWRSGGRIWRKFVLLVSVTFLIFIPGEAKAQQCPGVLHGALTSPMTPTQVSATARGVGRGSGNALYDFIGPTGCMATATGVTGAKPVCFASRAYSARASDFGASLIARFAMASHNTIGAGCIFNCPGGSCRVRGGDALPVELMGFSVNEPADDPETGEGTDTGSR